MATRGFEHFTATDVARHFLKHASRPIAGATLTPPGRSRSAAGNSTGDLADALLGQIRALQLPEPMREYRPFPDRKFRIDLAWVDRLIFVEVDGGEWSNGRHGRGAGMQTDCEKCNRLTLDGWAGFRVTGSQVRNGYAIQLVEQIFAATD